MQWLFISLNLPEFYAQVFLKAYYLLDNILYQVVSEFDSFDEYLKVVDAYVDIVLQNQMVSLSGLTSYFFNNVLNLHLYSVLLPLCFGIFSKL